MAEEQRVQDIRRFRAHQDIRRGDRRVEREATGSEAASCADVPVPLDALSARISRKACDRGLQGTAGAGKRHYSDGQGEFHRGIRRVVRQVQGCGQRESP